MARDRDDLVSASLLHPTAAWAVFDAAFYAAANPDARNLAGAALLLAHYRSAGAAAGFSPNRWFDEAFYRRCTPGVEASIRCGSVASGFEHYCQNCAGTAAPHWLFDPACYAEHNPALTGPVLKAAGFVNAYDHYLKFGAAEQRRAHAFFDPAAYARALDPQAAAACAESGAFKHFLQQVWTGEAPDHPEPRVSPHFDPVWYTAAYPVAAAAIREGRWHSALHHYLANRGDGLFRPLPSEPEVPGKPALPTAPARIKLHIDRPAHGGGEAIEPIEGHLDVVGWAASNQPVQSVDIYIDGAHCGRARHGLRTEGVAAAHPAFSHAMFAGFRFIDPAPAPPGRHALRIVARDASGLEAAAEFSALFKPAILGDGPWCLRRRMSGGEAALKSRLLEHAARSTEFLVVLVQAPAMPEAAVQRTLASLERQVFRGWRLHDASHPVHTAPTAPDCWLLPLTPGDELGVDALLELALCRLSHPAADFLYSDERRTDPATGSIAPFFKPDWSPDLLLATDYIGRLWAAAAPVAARAGITAANLAQDNNHDLVLRLTECAEQVAHVPRVLCETPSARIAAPADSVRRILARRGTDGTVEPGRVPHSWRARPSLARAPRVSVIMPTAGAGRLIEAALHTLRERTDAHDLQVIVIDTAPAAAAPWKKVVQTLADIVIEDTAPFNWSRLNNLGAARASGEALLFLNDDVVLAPREEGGDPGWLNAMLEALAMPGVGVVGPQLLYPGGLVQHAGVFLTPTGGRHAFAGLPGNAPGPFGLALTQRNVIAVTGACLLTRRALFEQSVGFDESLAITSNDVDYCLRVRQAGFRVVYTPFATLTHHESVTRGGLPEAASEARFAALWHPAALRDPCFNPNLSLSHADYRPEPEFAETLYPSRPLAAPATIRRILVIKLDQLGDFLLALPAIRALKRFFADARLTLLAAPAIAEFAAAEPAIDDILAFDFALRAAEAAPALSGLTGRLAAQHFDLAIDLRCHSETRQILQDCGATWRAGFDPAHEFPFLDIVGSMEPDTACRAKRTHMTETLLHLAAKVTTAFTAPEAGAGLFPQPAEARAAPRADGGQRRTAKIRERAAWPGDLPAPPPGAARIAIHPAAGTPIKQWPAGHFAALIGRLAEQHDCGFILLGTAADAPLADAIIAAVRPGVSIASVAGQTSMLGLARTLAACDFFIGNDSGPAHLAASLGLPALAIHSGVVDGREWSPAAAGASAAAIALRRRMRCSPCYLADAADCPRSVACLHDLTPAVVFAQAHEVMAASIA